jgi:hypothetical protein
LAAKLAKAVGFSVNDSNLRDLHESSPLLEELRDSFCSILEDTEICVTTFQEGHGFSKSVILDGKVGVSQLNTCPVANHI